MVIGTGRENFKDLCNLNTFIKRASTVDKYEVEMIQASQFMCVKFEHVMNIKYLLTTIAQSIH
jgi:hypothetical protein